MCDREKRYSTECQYQPLEHSPITPWTDSVYVLKTNSEPTKKKIKKQCQYRQALMSKIVIRTETILN